LRGVFKKYVFQLCVVTDKVNRLDQRLLRVKVV
jgi:hypothetical protein